METTLTKHERNLAAIVHAATLSRYFIPLGNIVLPLVLWLANRNELKFVDHNGKQALNFQISLILYSALAGLLTIPFFIGGFSDIFQNSLWHDINQWNSIDLHWESGNFPFNRFFWPVGIAGFVHMILSLVNLIYTIIATLKTNEGTYFEYPITIKFIK